MKIGYLGPAGTYSYEACEKYTKGKKDIEIFDFTSISEAIEALVTKDVEQIIVPIENSMQGSVFETIDCLLENENINIVNEVVIPINHYLMAYKKTYLLNVQEIYSHPQALAQCRKYIKQKLPNSVVKESLSTTNAIKDILGKENAACICNETCKEIYNLEILDSHVQDTNYNETRFIVLSILENKSVKNSKTSIVFSTKNKPGELYKILGLFNIFNINLSKIESRPTKMKLGEYIFWIDFEGDQKEEHIKVLLQQVKKSCSYLRILGSYNSM